MDPHNDRPDPRPPDRDHQPIPQPLSGGAGDWREPAINAPLAVGCTSRDARDAGGSGASRATGLVAIPWPDADLSWASLRGRWPVALRRAVSWGLLVEHAEHLEIFR